MGWQQSLTEEQNRLFQESIGLVRWVIYKYIHIGTIPGMEFDDLYQVGLEGLWKAVLKYDGSAKFSTFAVAVVKRFLYDYSRKMWTEHKKEEYIICLLQGKDNTVFEDSRIEQQLNQLKGKYRGVANKGVEAIMLRLRGYTNREIAKMFHCPERHVGAWIARAKNKLRKEYKVLTEIA